MGPHPIPRLPWDSDPAAIAERSPPKTPVRIEPGIAFGSCSVDLRDQTFSASSLRTNSVTFGLKVLSGAVGTRTATLWPSAISPSILFTVEFQRGNSAAL